MEYSYQLDEMVPETYGCCSCLKRKKDGFNILEIAGAMVQDDIEEFYSKEMVIFQNAELKGIGEQDPASNLRYKDDLETNNRVVNNYMNMYEAFKELNDNPIVISTYSRKQRKYSFKMEEDGTFTCTNMFTKEKEEDKKIMIENLTNRFGISSEKMKKLRECSKGARYYTYMADCISFILQYFYFYDSNTYEAKKIEPVVVDTNTIENGSKVLQPVTSGDRVWTPKDEYLYLYYKKGNSDSQDFLTPKVEKVDEIYEFFWELISLEENESKKKIREYMLSMNQYKRWSDYCKNDVDDVFTILMLINCFSTKDELSRKEVKIMNNLLNIVNPFRSQL